MVNHAKTTSKLALTFRAQRYFSSVVSGQRSQPSLKQQETWRPIIKEAILSTYCIPVVADIVL